MTEAANDYGSILSMGLSLGRMGNGDTGTGVVRLRRFQYLYGVKPDIVLRLLELLQDPERVPDAQSLLLTLFY